MESGEEKKREEKEKTCRGERNREIEKANQIYAGKERKGKGR